jgi:hypothetical protein
MGFNIRGFFPLWDTIEKVFLHFGIQWKRFFLLWDKTENNLRMANIFFSVVSHNAGVFLPLYPTPQQNLMQCTVSQKNLLLWIPQRCRFSSVYPTVEDIFLHCGIQRKIFFSVVEYNRRGFFYFGIQQKRFFQLWDTMEKNDATPNDIFKF